jgi:hypothetical protein
MPPENDDDASTPVDLEFRRPASAERKAFGTLEVSVHATAASLREIRQCWDAASPDKRRAMAADVAADARELGDAGHDLARLMAEIAAGA